MNTRHALALSIALLVGACADVPLHYTQARPGRLVDPALGVSGPGLHQLIVTRNEARKGGCPESAVYVNGKLAAVLAGGETVTMHLPAGFYSVASKGVQAECSPYTVDAVVGLPTALVVNVGFWATGEPHISTHEAVVTGIAASR